MSDYFVPGAELGASDTKSFQAFRSPVWQEEWTEVGWEVGGSLFIFNFKLPDSLLCPN